MLNVENNQSNQTITRAAAPLVETRPEQIRSLILNAVGDGFNTMLSLSRQTGLDNTTLVREIEFMNNLFIVVVPGPPLESYWLKSKRPKGRIVITDGRAVDMGRNRSALNVRNVRARVGIEATEMSSPEDVVAETLPAAPPPAERLPAPDEYREKMPLALLEEHPDNPRGIVDEDEQSFLDLTASIREKGVQEPLIITRISGVGGEKYRIVIGHRRNKASIAAGLEFVPCVIRPYSSAEEEEDAMLIENIQRQNLRPTQEAKAFKKKYIRLGKDINAVARDLGLTQSYIASRLKLLNLGLGIQIMIDRGELATGVGEILAVLSEEKQLRLLPRAQKMRQSDLRALVSKMRDLPSSKNQGTRKQQIEKKRATTEEERFTRTGAIRKLDSLGEGAWITVGFLKQAFDDVCLDSCLESKDESICNGCPMPRFVESVVRRRDRSEND